VANAARHGHHSSGSIVTTQPFKARGQVLGTNPGARITVSFIVHYFITDLD